MKKRTAFMRLSGICDILTSIYTLLVSSWGIFWLISMLTGFNDEITSTGSEVGDLLMWILISPIGIIVYLEIITLIFIGVGILSYSIVQFRFGIVSISRSNKNSDVFYPKRSGVVSMMIFQIVLTAVATFILIASESYTNVYFVVLVVAMAICFILKIAIVIVSKKEKVYYQNAQQARATAYRQSLNKAQQAQINNAINSTQSDTANKPNAPATPTSDTDNNTK